MLSTPLHLKILLHCYCSRGIIPNAQLPVISEAITSLKQDGMIERGDVHFTTTAKGAFFMEHILTLPFPDTVYKIPQK